MLVLGRVRSLLIVVAAAALLAACATSVSGTPNAPARTSSPVPSPSSSATGSTSAAPLPPVTIGPARFGSCGVSGSQLGVSASLASKLTISCAAIEVPLDYTKPNGSKIPIFIDRVHDSDNTDSTGSLLINPGGPGASGIDNALGIVSELSVTILQHFDIVGFDPRGVGLSSPITCVSNAEKDALNAASPDMTTLAGVNQAKSLSIEFNQGCEKDEGAKLPFFNTVNTARDMDLIRQAVGDPQMNYLGFSYGTELGAAYAHLFPAKVRVAVLDGAVDPLTNGTAETADQLAGFEQAFDQFADYCVKNTACKVLGNPRQVAEQIQAAALVTPLRTNDSRRPLTASLASTGILEALYSRSSWSSLASALISAKGGNGTDLLKLADEYAQRSSNGKYTNISDANTAISCNDTPAQQQSTASILATASTWAAQYPLFGKSFAPALLGCEQWQPIRTVPPEPTAPTETKVLVIGNLHDPATPYQGAKDLTTIMGNAELLSWDGEGHTSYLEGSSCIDNYVNQYLLSQTLPPPDTTCPK